MTEPTLTDNPTQHRFEVSVDGVLAGFTMYHDNPEEGLRTFPHTEIREEFGGRGLAKAVIAHGLDTSREQGWQVLPLCPAVRRFIRKNPEYVDLVPQERRGEFGLA